MAARPVFRYEHGQLAQVTFNNYERAPFRLPDDEMLYSFTIPRNARSRAVMERLNMTFGGSAVWRGLEHVWYFLRRGDT